MVGALAQDGGAPEWVLFMVPPGDYTVRDTWSPPACAAPAATPSSPTTCSCRIRGAAAGGFAAGQGPGRALAPEPDLPHAVLLLCAADTSPRRCWARPRAPMRVSANGPSRASRSTARRSPRKSRAGADGARRGRSRRRRTFAAARDAAHHGPEAEWPQLLARTIRDFTRVSEISVSAIDTLMMLSGTAGFASSSRSSAPGATSTLPRRISASTPKPTMAISAAQSSACLAIRTGRSFDKALEITEKAAHFGRPFASRSDD